MAPAAVFAVDAETPLCEICAPREHKHHSPSSRNEKQRRKLVPLKESAVAHGLVFDKMDFSSLYHSQGDRKPKTRASPEQQRAGKVDLSYYKTKVPMSVVSSRSRRKRGKVDSDQSSRSDSERRRNG